MKRRKVIALFSIIIFLVQIVCYAEEEKTEIVLNDENIEQIYETIDENQEMNIYSEAAVLMEAKTGKVLYDKNMHERKYPASTTKILTAIIAIAAISAIVIQINIVIPFIFPNPYLV